MSIAHAITTAEQLLEAGDIGRCELVRGELIMMPPAGANHGRIVSRIDRRLGTHVESHGLGEVFGAETGFIIRREPDTVRAPDIAFVRRDRMHLVKERGFFPGAPDLAVEVLSPEDSAASVLDKVQDWLDGATAAVWVVDPKRKTIRVYEQAKPPRSFSEADALTSGDLLQGLSIAVADIFK